MTKKKPYPHSFAKRLTWRIMLTLLVVMGITSAMIFGSAMVTIYAESNVYCTRLLKNKNKEVRQILSDIYVASTNTIPTIEENLDKPDKMYDIMERIVRLNPAIRSCGISFKENYYPKKGRLFCPYAVRRDSTTIERRNIGDDHDYLNEEWFLEGLTVEKGYWSKPFFDGTDQKTALVSYIAPIHDAKGQTIAVFGADLLLSYLEDDLIGSSNFQINEQANYSIYYFIIDSTGTFIMHPEEKRVINENYFTYAKKSPDSLATELGKKMVSRKKSSIINDEYGNELVLEGTNVHVFFSHIKHTNWSICLVIPSIIINLFGYILGGMLLFMIAIGLIVIFFVGRRSIKKATKPLKQLAISADEVAKGNFDTSLPKLKSRDEIHLLRDSFEQMQYSLTRYVEELKTTTTQQASIESELKIAHNIQMSMLPKIFPPYPERSDIDIYGQLTPAKAVGGDLFDFYIREEKLYFCIGDVSGKGVPASLVMAVTRSLFRNISSHVSAPEEIVKGINASMSEGNEMNMFVTLFIGVLDLSTGILCYCNAGHNAPIIIGQEVDWLPCDANMPVGIVKDWTFTLQQVTLQSQTTIFLYTDGLNEAEDNAHNQFGEQRMLDIAQMMQKEQHYQPQHIIQRMSDAVHLFVGTAEQSDDLTMLAIQYT